MDDSYIRKRNALLAVPFVALWLFWSIGFPVLSKQPVMSSNLYIGWFPALIGFTFALSLSGDWFRKLVWGAAMPIVPILITLVFLSRGTDAEGTMWALIFSVGPFLVYGLGIALGIGITQVVSGRVKQ